jgi:hypothetical protein
LLGLDQDDPELIQTIKRDYLINPSSQDYNFSSKVPNLDGQFGQPQVIDEIFKGKGLFK